MKKWFLIGVGLMVMVLLAGCGPNSEYEALQSDYATLLEENTSLEAELERTQSDLTNVQADYDELNTEYTTLQADYDELDAEYTTSQVDYEAVQSELAEIKEVYPPQYFNNYNELDDWVSEHCLGDQGTGLLRQNLQLQKEALADGYIWSVGYDRDSGYVISVVIAGDRVYWVWLDGFLEWIATR